jgi:hypothetical protein
MCRELSTAPRRTPPSFFPCPHSHIGTHPTLVPPKIAPFLSCAYVEPILQSLCFQIHARNGGMPPPRRSDVYTLRRASDLSPFFSNTCALFCAFLHSQETQLFSFQPLPHSTSKNTTTEGLHPLSQKLFSLRPVPPSVPYLIPSRAPRFAEGYPSLDFSTHNSPPTTHAPQFLTPAAREALR